MINTDMPAAGRYALTRDAAGSKTSGSAEALVVHHAADGVTLSGPGGSELGVTYGTGWNGRNEAWAKTPHDDMADPRLVLSDLRHSAAAFPHALNVIEQFVDAAGPTDMTRTGY